MEAHITDVHQPLPPRILHKIIERSHDLIHH